MPPPVGARAPAKASSGRRKGACRIPLQRHSTGHEAAPPQTSHTQPTPPPFVLQGALPARCHWQAAQREGLPPAPATLDAYSIKDRLQVGAGACVCVCVYLCMCACKCVHACLQQQRSYAGMAVMAGAVASAHWFLCGRCTKERMHSVACRWRRPGACMATPWKDCKACAGFVRVCACVFARWHRAVTML